MDDKPDTDWITFASKQVNPFSPTRYILEKGESYGGSRMTIIENDLIFGITFLISLTIGSVIILGVIFGIQWIVIG